MSSIEDKPCSELKQALLGCSLFVRGDDSYTSCTIAEPVNTESYFGVMTKLEHTELWCKENKNERKQADTQKEGTPTENSIEKNKKYAKHFFRHLTALFLTNVSLEKKGKLSMYIDILLKMFLLFTAKTRLAKKRNITTYFDRLSPDLAIRVLLIKEKMSRIEMAIKKKLSTVPENTVLNADVMTLFFDDKQVFSNIMQQKLARHWIKELVESKKIRSNLRSSVVAKWEEIKSKEAKIQPWVQEKLSPIVDKLQKNLSMTTFTTLKKSPFSTLLYFAVLKYNLIKLHNNTDPEYHSFPVFNKYFLESIRSDFACLKK